MTRQLYVVIQEPQHRYRLAFASAVWFTHAASKAEAVRNFKELCPEATHARDRAFKSPTAQLVTTGGPAIRV